eukprot:6489415-Amphidinium_carterae.1
MEEFQAQPANVTVEVVDKGHNPRTVREERLFHGCHVLAKLVAFGRENCQMRPLCRARQHAARIQRIGLGIQRQQGRVGGLVDRHRARCVKEHPLLSNRMPPACAGKFAPHVA